jgi:hypothetical protein
MERHRLTEHGLADAYKETTDIEAGWIESRCLACGGD